MKLYDKNLVIHNINLKSLAEYSTKTRDISYIYSDEGIFRIYDKNDLHSIVINDGKLDVLENYVNNHTFVIDHTIIKKQKPFVSHIPTNHVKMDYNINYYTLREKSPIMLVIEKNYDNKICDVYFMLHSTYAAYSDADIHNPFIKDDIKTFYDLLQQ